MTNSNPISNISIYNHTDTKEVSTNWLKEKVKQSLKLVLKLNIKNDKKILENLSDIEISLISDDEIKKIHKEFFDSPTTTDVITFLHGEILISVDTAKKNSSIYNSTFKSEILLYSIHGLLHLKGYIDYNENDRKIMNKIQQNILTKIL